MKYSRREIVGIVLWWAEGTKSRRDTRWKNAVSYPVEITNTSPAIINVFIDFLRLDLKISNTKLRVQIQIHEGDNKKDLENYWSGITGVPIKQFNKTIIRPRGNKIGKSKGTCKVRFADKTIYKLLEKRLDMALKGIYESNEPIIKMYTGVDHLC